MNRHALFLYLVLIWIWNCVGWSDVSAYRLKNQPLSGRKFRQLSRGPQRVSVFVLHGSRRAPFSHSFDNSGFDRSLDIKQEKLKRILKDELIDIVCNEKFYSFKKPDTPTIRSFVIKVIELNGDNSIAKIFFSGGKAPVHRRQLLLWLHENTKHIQHLLHTNLRRFRSVPRISFHLLNPDATRLKRNIMIEIAEEQKRRARMDAAGITEETENSEEGEVQEEEEQFVDYEEISADDPSQSTYDEFEEEDDEYSEDSHVDEENDDE